MKKTKLLGALLFSVVATTTAAFAAACFPKTANYKVEFIGGAGASGTMVTQVVEEGSSFVVPENAFTNGDKIFLYYLNGETVVNEGDELTVTSNVSLTAVWGNTVTFEGSGATGEMNTATVVSGTEYTVPENAFTNGDKTFMYFSDGANQVAIGDKITVSTNVTLTAVWGYNFAYEGISETLLQVGTVHTVSEFAGNVPFGKLFAGYSDGTTQYSVGDTITVNADITLSPVFNVDTSLIEGTKYSYPGSTTAYVQFNEDGTIYRAFHVKNDSFGVDYDNVTSASVYELTKEFDGTSLEYKFQYSTSQPLQTVKLTFSENGVVTALVTLSENNQSQSFVLYCGEKKEYTTEVGTLTAFVTETTANYGWAATDGEYTAVTLTDEIEVGNIVKVMNGDVEIIEIQFTETGVRTVGAEKGTVIDGYTLDGWGNATKNGETVAYRISPKTSYVVIGNKGYALENDVYVEKQSDGVQNVFVKVDGSYVYSLDFDGFGTVYAVQKTYSTYEYVGVYTVSGDTITVTDCNYSFDKTYSVIENGNVLSVSSYSGVEYYVIDGYVSNEQLDDEASGDTWKTENGLALVINSTAKTVTLNFNNSYIDGTFTYKENFNGSVLTFTNPTSYASWKLTISENEITLEDEEWNEYSFFRTVNVILKAEGYSDITVQAVQGDTFVPDYSAVDSSGNKKLVGWTDGENNYSVGKAITAKAGLVLTAVYADYDITPFVGDWYKASSTSKQLSVTSSTDGDVIVLNMSSYVVKYFATNGNKLLVVYDYYSTVYAVEYEIVGGVVTDESNNQLYKGERVEYKTSVDGNTYYVITIGENAFANFLTDSKYDYTKAEITGTIADGNEITLTANGVSKSVKITGESFLFKGAEAGKVINGYTLNGYGTAVKSDFDTVEYKVNKAGVLILNNVGYELVEGNYVEKAADAYKGVVLIDKDEKTYTLDGYGEVAYSFSSSSSVNLSTYVVENGVLCEIDGRVVTKYGNVYVYTNSYSAVVYTLKETTPVQVESGIYKNAEETFTITVDASAKTVTVDSDNIFDKGNVSEKSYSIVSNTGIAKYTDNDYNTNYFLMDGDNLIVVISDTASTKIVVLATLSSSLEEPEDPSATDGWEGIYTYTAYSNIITVTVDGKGNADFNGNAVTYTVGSNSITFSNWYTLYNNNGSYEMEDGDYNFYDVTKEEITTGSTDTSDWVGKYTYPISDWSDNRVCNVAADGTYTYFDMDMDGFTTATGSGTCTVVAGKLVFDNGISFEEYTSSMVKVYNADGSYLTTAEKK